MLSIGASHILSRQFLPICVIATKSNLYFKREKNMAEPTERRQYPRFHVPGATISYKPHHLLQGHKKTCPVLTLSKGGVSFLTHNPLKPGQELSVTFTSKEDTINLQTRVIFCFPHPRMTYSYHVGLAFAPFDLGKSCNSPEALKVFDKLEKEHSKPTTPLHVVTPKTT